jgi:Putative zinc-finger
LTQPLEHCKECVDLLGEYIEGTLPPDKAKALEDHLSLCPPCITFVRTYRATRKLCRSALKREMPGELMSSLKSFLGTQIPGFTCSNEDIEPASASPAADRAAKKV